MFNHFTERMLYVCTCNVCILHVITHIQSANEFTSFVLTDSQLHTYMYYLMPSATPEAIRISHVPYGKNEESDSRQSKTSDCKSLGVQLICCEIDIVCNNITLTLHLEVWNVLYPLYGRILNGQTGKTVE